MLSTYKCTIATHDVSNYLSYSNSYFTQTQFSCKIGPRGEEVELWGHIHLKKCIGVVEK